MLRDHFHPPLRGHRNWTSLHAAWATHIATDLNGVLPEGYVAENFAKFGIEIDVATYYDPDRVREAVAEYRAPEPNMRLDVSALIDEVEVRVYYDLGDLVLVGAIEIVSPSNKDRPSTRDAFVSKCASLIQQGVGLLIVDIVTERRANLHNELLARWSPKELRPMASDLYASAYHLVDRDGITQLEAWQEPIALGGPLPTMPLFLRGGPCVPVALEAPYERACAGLKID